MARALTFFTAGLVCRSARSRDARAVANPQGDAAMKKPPSWMLMLACCVVASTAAADDPPHSDRAAVLAVIGDTPYDAEQQADFPSLIAAINDEPDVRRV